MEHGERVFSAREVQEAAGLTYRQLNDWEARGALPTDPDRDRGWRRFSPREVFMLMVCSEIRRRFGTPVDRVKFVSECMLQPGADHLSVAIELMGLLGVGVWLMTDFEETFVMDSELEFRDMASLGYFGGDSPAGYVFVKLNPLVNQLLACLKEPVHLPAHGRGYEIMSEIRKRFSIDSAEEFEVLEAIRSGDYSKIEVATKDGRVRTIRTTSHLEPTEPIEKLLGNHDYQKLIVTKRDGRVVSVEQQATQKVEP